jgi:hypothetical protein
MIPTSGHANPYDDGVVHHPHDDGHGHDDTHNDDVGHEPADVHPRAVVMSAIALFAVVLVSQVLMYFLFGWFDRQAAANDPRISPLAAPATQMPNRTDAAAFSPNQNAPQLLTNEPMALERYHAEQQKRLGEYGWVDQGTGVSHLPIEAAKKLIAERGLPVREGGAPPAFTVRPEVRGEASGGRTVTVDLPDRATTPAPQGGPSEHGQPPAKPHDGGH